MPAQANENPEHNASATETAWKSLYRVGGAAAVAMAVFIPIQVIVFVLWPPPTTVIGWFALYQSNWLIGLLDMDLLLIIDQILMGLVMLAVYVSFRQTSHSLAAIALMLGLLGIAAYFASTAAFEMLSLSNHFAAATTEAEKSILLAAGQVMLSNWQGTAFDVGYVMEGIALLIIGVVMLRGTIFGKATACVGIALGILSLVPPTVGTVGILFALGSLVPLEIWNILVARRLFQLAKAA